MSGNDCSRLCHHMRARVWSHERDRANHRDFCDFMNDRPHCLARIGATHKAMFNLLNLPRPGLLEYRS